MPSRYLKESICTSGEINQLSPEAERMFYRLIVKCDDFGRMLAQPTLLRAECFPLQVDRIKDVQIVEWVTELEKAGLVWVYFKDGKDYLELVTFTKHNKPRASASKYPPPPVDASKCIQMLADASKCKQMLPYSYSYSYSYSVFGIRKCEQMQTVANATLPDSPEPRNNGKVPTNEILSLFRVGCPALPQPTKITGPRFKTLKARWDDTKHDLSIFAAVFQRVNQSDFLSGNTKGGFLATFDWIMNPTNWLKIQEGNYDNRGTKHKGDCAASVGQLEGWRRVAYQGPGAVPDKGESEPATGAGERPGTGELGAQGAGAALADAGGPAGNRKDSPGGGDSPGAEVAGPAGHVDNSVGVTRPTPGL